jgi:flagellar basal-body rod protein FlgB
MLTWGIWHDYCLIWCWAEIVYTTPAPVFRQEDAGGRERIEVAKISSIVDLIEAGIEAESLRQKAIASNIANLETPGYRRIDVQFEQLLAGALNSSEDLDISELEPQLYRPNRTPLKANGNDVNLETEVGEMVKNTLRHKTYIRVLSKKYRQLELAIDTK